MARFKRNASKRTGVRVRRVRKAVRRAPSKVQKKMVQRVVRSMAETKQTRILYTKTDITGLAPYNGVNWALDNGLFALSPVQNRIDIAQGDGEGDRTGSRITTKASYLSGIFYAPPYDVTYNPTPRPQEVMVIIFKVIGGGSNIISDLTGLFQGGNSTVSPTTSLIDTTLPFNTDKYRVFYKRIFKVGVSDAGGTGTSAVYQSYTNNDYKRNCRFFIPITKYLDKIMKYDGSSRSANNAQLYMAVLPVNADGSQPASGNSLRTVCMVMTQVYKFQDM